MPQADHLSLTVDAVASSSSNSMSIKAILDQDITLEDYPSAV